MKKKGFTLIELLAVIVVLAIIALIATPIVMSVIKSAKKGAAERSADSYIGAVETVVATERLDGNILEGEYIIQSDGNLCPTSGCGNSDKDKIVIDVKGTKPSSGKITISNGNVDKKSSEMTIGDYDVSYDEENKKYEAVKLETYKITYKLTNVSGSNVTSITTKDVKTLKFIANSGYQLPASVTVSEATYAWDKEAGTLVLSKVTGNVTVTIVGEEAKAKTYTNGEVVYFNVTTGSKCSSSDYTEAQSNTRVKSGCMKFYAFNDDGKDTVNLLLDHNTTALVAWETSDSDISNQLSSDVSNWNDTIKSSARLIDSSEIISITKSSSTVSQTVEKDRVEVVRLNSIYDYDVVPLAPSADPTYYFHTNSTTAYKGEAGTNKYAWLFDNTKDCTTYGCNKTDSGTNGYWTGDKNPDLYNNAYCVTYEGKFTQQASTTATLYGVRPVIEVQKSKLR